MHAKNFTPSELVQKLQARMQSLGYLSWSAPKGIFFDTKNKPFIEGVETRTSIFYKFPKGLNESLTAETCMLIEADTKKRLG